MKNKYTLKVSKIENGPGYWNSSLCEIYKNEEKVGEYIRHYHSFCESTFFPFELNEKEYALYSSDYTTVSIMSLPDCKQIELKKNNLDSMCPTEIYVPKYHKYTYESMGVETKREDLKNRVFCEHVEDGEEFEKYKDQYFFSDKAFVLGCVWGDDSSWKFNLLDLSKIEEGELNYVNRALDPEWIYEEFPNYCALKDIYCYYDSEGRMMGFDLPKIENIYFKEHQENKLKEQENI